MPQAIAAFCYLYNIQRLGLNQLTPEDDNKEKIQLLSCHCIDIMQYSLFIEEAVPAAGLYL